MSGSDIADAMMIAPMILALWVLLFILARQVWRETR